MTATRRPLSANGPAPDEHQHEVLAAAEAAGIAIEGPVGPSEEERVERDRRFSEGLRTLRTSIGSRLDERTLMIAGGIVAPVGIIVVLLGWYGASRTFNVYEQIPYLISGGLLGVALVFLGAFFYFTHWLTQLVKEHRAQSNAIVEALTRLQDEVGRMNAVPERDDGLAAAAPAALVATARGTMAHRPTCSVVAAKSDLRQVTAEDGLEPCRLCDPYGEEA